MRRSSNADELSPRTARSYTSQSYFGGIRDFMPRQTPFRVGVCYRDLAASSGSGFRASSSRQKDEGTRRSGSSGNNASWSCGGDGTAPVVRWIGNMFPPPPLFLHEPGRFQGTQVDSSRLGGCRQTLDVERVRRQTTRRQSVTETRSHGFDSRRLQGGVRLSAGRRADLPARGSIGASAEYRPRLPVGAADEQRAGVYISAVHRLVRRPRGGDPLHLVHPAGQARPECLDRAFQPELSHGGAQRPSL